MLIPGEEVGRLLVTKLSCVYKYVHNCSVCMLASLLMYSGLKEDMKKSVKDYVDGNLNPSKGGREGQYCIV